MRIALATCRPLPEPDPDESLLVEALKAAGLEAVCVPWRDETIDLSEYAMCIVRSTWDYPLHPVEFRHWIDRAASQTRLLNPAEVLHWNLHKGYLRTLAETGIRTIETCWHTADDRLSLSAVLAEHGWTDYVIKPAISAGSMNTRRFHRSELRSASAFMEDLAQHHDVMIQPYVQTVEAPGERAVVWIDGEFTHAVVKSARFDGGDEHVSEAVEPTADELKFAAQVLANAPEDLLYGRVDMVPDDSGALQLAELELLEPSLFLQQSPAALDRLVQAVAKRCSASTS